MILILIALITSAVHAYLLIRYANKGYKSRHLMAALLGLFLALGTGLSLVIYSIAGWEWLAAEHKTHIINREYGTTYTREEVFYASDVIETIRALDRNRYEINGDLGRGAAKP